MLENLPRDFDFSPWTAAPVIVKENAVKDAINTEFAKAYAEKTGKPLHWYYSTDRLKGKVLNDPDIVTHLCDLPSSKTSQRLGRIPLAIGMPVIITQNHDVGGGIVNGSIGTLTKIRYVCDHLTGHRHLTSCAVRLTNLGADVMYLHGSSVRRHVAVNSGLVIGYSNNDGSGCFPDKVVPVSSLCRRCAPSLLLRLVCLAQASKHSEILCGCGIRREKMSICQKKFVSLCSKTLH